MSEQARAGIVIRPMGVGEVLDVGFNLARRNYGRLLLIAAWALVPAFTLSALLTVVAQQALLAGVESGQMGEFLAGLRNFLAGGIIVGLLSALANAAVAAACGRLIQPTGDPADLSAARLYARAFRRLLPLVGGAILFLLTMIPLVLLLPLAVYVLVRWWLWWCAVLIEDVGPVAALGRSWRLTRGSWWHSFAILLASSLIVAVLSSVVSGIFDLAGRFVFLIVNSPAVLVLSSFVGSLVGSAIATPPSVAILVVLYYELRARTEGFDLEQRARLIPSLN